jgi:hypothetical protein
MIWAGELYILSPSDMAGQVSTVLNIDREIAAAVLGVLDQVANLQLAENVLHDPPGGAFLSLMSGATLKCV